MRVIAGTFRGRALDAPPWRTTRPITDRVKETLFNILGHRLGAPGELPAIAVLDVFAGSGSLGIEALSRGARTCTFVERDRPALRSLRQNIRLLRIERACTVLTDNAWTMRWPRLHEGFGLVFIDPPYRDADEPLRLVDLLERLGGSLATDGLVVYRREATGPPPLAEGLRSLRVVDERRIARMRLIFLAPRQDSPATDPGRDHPGSPDPAGP